MEFLDLSKQRYSVRKFDPRPVEKEKLDLVLEAGLDCRAVDKVRFYVTGTQKRPKLTGNTKLLNRSDGTRDENVAYYLDKPDALYANYQPFMK